MINTYGSYEYRQQDVTGASPIQLIVMVYDQAIKACEIKNFDKAVKAINILRDALDFDYGEIASNLFGLYQWCLECLRAGNFAESSKVLVGLREAWVEAEKNLVESGEGLPNTANHTERVTSA